MLDYFILDAILVSRPSNQNSGTNGRLLRQRRSSSVQGVQYEIIEL